MKKLMLVLLRFFRWLKNFAVGALMLSRACVGAGFIFLTHFLKKKTHKAKEKKSSLGAIKKQEILEEKNDNGVPYYSSKQNNDVIAYYSLRQNNETELLPTDRQKFISLEKMQEHLENKNKFIIVEKLLVPKMNHRYEHFKLKWDENTIQCLIDFEDAPKKKKEISTMSLCSPPDYLPVPSDDFSNASESLLLTPGSFFLENAILESLFSKIERVYENAEADLHKAYGEKFSQKEIVLTETSLKK